MLRTQGLFISDLPGELEHSDSQLADLAGNACPDCSVLVVDVFVVIVIRVISVSYLLSEWVLCVTGCLFCFSDH